MMKAFKFLFAVVSLCALTLTVAAAEERPRRNESGKNQLSTHRSLLPLSVSGLIHLYTADGSNADDVVGGAVGTFGSTTKFVTGKNGLGFEFDGTASSLVSLPVNFNKNVFPQFTMGLWVRLHTLDTNAWALTNDNGFYDRAIILNDGRFGGVAAGIGGTYASTLPSITASEWHCVAVAYDENIQEATVYYDGSTQRIEGTSVGTGHSDASLGGNAGFFTDYVDGQIDEVFMFDRYLSQTEIGTVCSELSTADRGPGPAPAPAPAPAPPPQACFSGVNTIQVLKDSGDVATIAMADLQLGDQVLVDDSKFEPVYSFGHYHKTRSSEYLQLYIAGSQPLELSPNHMVFVGGEARRADQVAVGDQINSPQGGTNTVTKVTNVERPGLYMPLTPSGKIVVNDNYMASVYVSIEEQVPNVIHHPLIEGWLSEQHIMHWWLSPSRMICMGVSPNICAKWDPSTQKSGEGLLFWLSFGNSFAHFGSRQILLIQFLLGVPLLCLFGFLYALEFLVGAAKAPMLIVISFAVAAWFLNKRAMGSLYGRYKKLE